MLGEAHPTYKLYNEVTTEAIFDRRFHDINQDKGCLYITKQLIGIIHS